LACGRALPVHSPLVNHRASLIMTHKEKLGIGIIIGLFVIFGLLLWFTMEPPAGGSGSFENNVIIDQRVKNLNKSQ